MGKKGKNHISIPVVKQGKDICRLIFQKAEDGKFDIKLEFRGNPYQICTYRLFAFQPIVWNVENPQNVNMSYHHGVNGKPITIHLKDETKQGKEKYRSLPITQILPPNTNQLFPIPLFKLEIPDSLVRNAPEYKAKSYHYVLDAGKANVLEIYMAAENFSMDTYTDDAYATLLLPQIALSMEYFATNTVISDYQKSAHFIPGGEPEVRFMSIGGMPGMKLFVDTYTVLEWNELWNQLHVTFIENGLAEEILFCTKVQYPKMNLRPDVYDNIYLGGATLEQLKPPDGPLSKLPAMCNTTILRTLSSSDLSRDKKEELENRASDARGRLYREMYLFEKNLEKQKVYYLTKAEKFMSALETLQAVVRRKAEKNAIGNR